MADESILLAIPEGWSAKGRDAFRTAARTLAAERSSTANDVVSAQADGIAAEFGLAAAIRIVNDLVHQGWSLDVDADGVVKVTPPETEADPVAEKHRVRQQEQLKRDEQLAEPAVRRFIGEMERPREFNGKFVSIFSVMRDGAELAEELRDLSQQPGPAEAWKTAIDPYVQVISNGDRCVHTGLRLVDVWRYFRHTWSNQYTSTPGRTMLILVRDRAAPFHPVIGIAALGSSIVQIRERDRWIGWHPDQFLADLTAKPTLRAARWIVRRVEQGLAELYIEDLVADGLFWPSLSTAPTLDAIQRLEQEAARRRSAHHRFARRSDFKSRVDDAAWRERAESNLFRSKRCLSLASLLRARLTLEPFLYPTPTKRGLRDALLDAEGRRVISSILRRAKAESVGTEIADLTVCGAIAPYNSLLGGKLVSMLAVSPTVIRAYHERYRSHASEIASSMAGRPIMRRSHLVFVGTTSLYGSGSSQYNRVRIPKDVLGGKAELCFHELGRSKSFGTSHLSSKSFAELLQLSEQSRNGVRVNSIFGEGVSPKLRKARDGLDRLGWPSNDLLQHRRQRIVYGVPLISNLLGYLLGIENEPRYLVRPSLRGDVEKIALWWMKRWLSKRVESDAVLENVAAHTTTRPVRHGARVVLPPLGADAAPS